MANKLITLAGLSRFLTKCDERYLNKVENVGSNPSHIYHLKPGTLIAVIENEKELKIVSPSNAKVGEAYRIMFQAKINQPTISLVDANLEPWFVLREGRPTAYFDDSDAEDIFNLPYIKANSWVLLEYKQLPNRQWTVRAEVYYNWS